MGICKEGLFFHFASTGGLIIGGSRSRTFSAKPKLNNFGFATAATLVASQRSQPKLCVKTDFSHQEKTVFLVFRRSFMFDDRSGGADCICGQRSYQGEEEDDPAAV